MRVISRTFLVFFAAVAAVGVIAGGGCTKRGHITPSPTPPAAQTIFVNPATGSDSTGNGSSPKPYKTLTKAVSVLPSAEPFTDTIELAPGNYDAANGEKFPIAIPTSVSIAGTSYGNGFKAGAYINGNGEDTAYEQLAGLKPHSLYATLRIATMAANAGISDVYLGSEALAIPAGATYVASDVLGGLSGSAVTFGAGIRTRSAHANGVLVPSGNFTCSNCLIEGTDYAIAARTIPNASSSPGVSLSGGQGLIASAEVGIQTDGSASLTIASQTFQQLSSRPNYVYADTLAPLPGVTIAPAIVDFGTANSSCGNGSTGDNDLAGTRIAGLYVTVPSAVVCAYNDVWKAGVQGAGPNNRYSHTQHFGPDSNYTKCTNDPPCNVIVAKTATGAGVTVGGNIGPTSSPTVYPSVTPTPTATPSG